MIFDKKITDVKTADNQFVLIIALIIRYFRNVSQKDLLCEWVSLANQN